MFTTSLPGRVTGAFAVTLEADESTTVGKIGLGLHLSGIGGLTVTPVGAADPADGYLVPEDESLDLSGRVTLCNTTDDDVTFYGLLIDTI